MIRKKLFFVTTLVIVIISVSGAFLSSFLSYRGSDLLMFSIDNIEALAQNEQFDWKDSSSMGTKKIVIKEGYWETYINPYWGVMSYWVAEQTEDITCCVTSNQSSKCNQVLQDSRCSS